MNNNFEPEETTDEPKRKERTPTKYYREAMLKEYQKLQKKHGSEEFAEYGFAPESKAEKAFERFYISLRGLERRGIERTPDDQARHARWHLGQVLRRLSKQHVTAQAETDAPADQELAAQAV